MQGSEGATPPREFRSAGAFIVGVLIWGAFCVAAGPVIFVAERLIPPGEYELVQALVASVGLVLVCFELGRTHIYIAVGRKGASPAVRFTPAVAGGIAAGLWSWAYVAYRVRDLASGGMDPLSRFVDAASAMPVSLGWVGCAAAVAGTMGGTFALRELRGTASAGGGAPAASGAGAYAALERAGAGTALIVIGAVSTVAMTAVAGLGFAVLLGSVLGAVLGGGSSASSPVLSILGWGAVAGSPGTVLGLVLLGAGIVRRWVVGRSSHRSRVQRTRVAVIAVVALSLVGVGALFMPGMAARYATRAASELVLGKVREQASNAYPGWTVERVFHGTAASKKNEFAFQLEWAGPETFRVSQSGSWDVIDSDAATLHPIPSALTDRACAESFIRAFHARHPEPDLVVALTGGDSEHIRTMGAKGEDFSVSYKGLQNYETGLSAGLPSWETNATERWHATATTSGITWEYVGEGTPPPKVWP